ncbi:MAG: Nif3-like dinuclear metal center hexameric protein [Bacteroidales bacterium]|jgi:dinuclear metal center YbgI/SA1388 family protein|nr:Nif3-like dinuclear metal center hexameric protein [Bacteroidales bacterium]
MILHEIITAIEEFAPLSYQESYDNAGLILGNPQQEITAALLTIDVTPAVINEAIAIGANCIISHHPLIFSGLKHLRGETDVERCVIKAIQHNIAIYAAHTNLDVVFCGVNHKIAQKLNLQHLQILQPTENNPNVGSGMIGNLAKPVPVLDFLEQVKQIFGCKVVKTSALCKSTISRIALCGGSGSFLIQQAKQQHADIFLTADIKYHDFFNAENQIIIADLGHYETEQFTKDIFYEILNKKFPTFALNFSLVTTNPITYI